LTQLAADGVGEMQLNLNIELLGVP
jgi:hypothetical protein